MIQSVYFSPAGTTKLITNHIADCLSDILNLPKEEYDFTLPEARKQTLSFSENDLIIFGMPVYAGRIPNKILPFIQSQIKGNGCIAIPVVVYGNRNYDDALVELHNELKANGCYIPGAAAIVSRHCFSDKIGAGRPDERDYTQIKKFAEKIAKKISQISSKEALPALSIPGTNPPEKYYTPKGSDGKPAVFLKAVPEIDEEKCVKCGICSKVCPMGSIHMDSTKELPVIAGICIKCQACILSCSTQAIKLTYPAFLSHKQMLEENFMERKEPEFFF
ncbi:MAG: EFR1 family ferrodoxin [Lachnospiraceae bacterium]|nr:EFR1 family ferrodoxin [Lachnospiraceae bacterium]